MAIDPKTVQCKDCVFYDDRPVPGVGGAIPDERGFCRRYAPTVYTGHVNYARNPRFKWPSVQPTDSCGEFEKRA